MTIAAHTAETKNQRTGSPLEVLLVFLKLGVTCFGGPIAHIGYFREEFVVRRRWIEEQVYADLVGRASSYPVPPAAKSDFRSA
jgi:chromate transporter